MSSLPRFIRLALASALLASTAVATHAADTDGVRVRGTVIARAGDTLQVQTREGPAVSIALSAGWGVSAVKAMALADIRPGDYVGIASEKSVTGGDGAIEVLVFPAEMKGTGEGSFDWDVKPQSTMTNGSVTNATNGAVLGVAGRTLTVGYHGQSRAISVEADTPVVTLVPGTADDVHPGVAVFVPAQRSADGKLSAGRVIVGKDGVVPRM